MLMEILILKSTQLFFTIPVLALLKMVLSLRVGQRILTIRLWIFLIIRIQRMMNLKQQLFL